MRAFIAVNLDDSLRRAIADAQEALRASGADVKWVRAESMHLTLKFLGWVDDARIPEIVKAVGAALAGQPSFRLRLADVGSFPTSTAPRVVWVGVKEGAAELAELSRLVEDAVEPLGFEKEERPFSPHVTVGRVKSPSGRQALTAAMRETAEREFGEMQVTKVELMRSDLRPTGPIYTSQRVFELTTTRAREGEG
jgi:2'-5' RNA ligase